MIPAPNPSPSANRVRSTKGDGDRRSHRTNAISRITVEARRDAIATVGPDRPSVDSASRSDAVAGTSNASPTKSNGARAARIRVRGSSSRPSTIPIAPAGTFT